MNNLFSNKGKIVIVDDDIMELVSLVSEFEERGKLKELDELITSLHIQTSRSKQE